MNFGCPTATGFADRLGAVFFSNVIEYCRQRFGDLYIGGVYGAATNGLFAVAGEISIVPITEVAAPINRAAYSKYAEDVRANRRLGPSYLSIARLAGIGFLDLWARVWRIALGTIVMGAGLWFIFATPSLDHVRVVLLTFVAKIAIGVVVYAGVVWVAWLACGKPSGPEQAVLELIVRFVRRRTSRLAGDAT